MYGHFLILPLNHCCVSCDILRARTCYTIYMSSVETHSSTAYHYIPCHHFHHRQNALRKCINLVADSCTGHASPHTADVHLAQSQEHISSLSKSHAFTCSATLHQVLLKVTEATDTVKTLIPIAFTGLQSIHRRANEHRRARRRPFMFFSCRTGFKAILGIVMLMYFVPFKVSE
jgi:hypothetical protein